MKYVFGAALLAHASLGGMTPVQSAIGSFKNRGPGVFDWRKRNRGSIATNTHKHKREIARRLRQGAIA